MADWDANSPELQRNLQELGRRVAADAAARQPLSSATIRAWQALIMRGLEPADGEPFGTYRGEAGLESYDVEVGGLPGAPAERVAAALAAFDRILAEQLDEMDHTVRREHLDEDLTGDACIPVPNGNGRTAQILVNSIALRYGLPAFSGCVPARRGVRLGGPPSDGGEVKRLSRRWTGRGAGPLPPPWHARSDRGRLRRGQRGKTWLRKNCHIAAVASMSSRAQL